MRYTVKIMLTALMAVSFLPLYGLNINEVRVDQPGNPDDEEYVEIKGTPGESLDGVWFLYIGDHSGTGATKGSGVIEIALDLTGFSIPDDGHFLMLGASFDGGVFGLNIGDVDYLYEGFGNALENSDNVTAMLVNGYTGTEILGIDFQLGDLAVDIDDNDDGTPNATLPWTSVIDAVGIFEGATSGEFCYGEAFGFVNVGPAGTFAPSHIWLGDNDGAWQLGEYNVFEEDNNGTVIGLNPDGFDTPGAPNPDSPPATFEPIINELSTVFVEEGSEFMISGYNLTTVTSVKISDIEASFVVDGNHLDVTVPAGATTGELVITNPDGVEYSQNLLVVGDLDTIVYSTDFSDGVGGYNTYSVASTANWETDSYGDSNSIEANGYGADEASDDWLIMPAVDLTATSNAYVRLGHERVFGGPPLEVKISTDYTGSGDPTLSTWTDVPAILAGDDTREIVDSGLTDISAFDGQVVYVAIRYTSEGTGPGEGAIDDIHYLALGGDSADIGGPFEWVDSAEYGWVGSVSGNLAYAYDLGWINTANHPWIWQADFGWVFSYIRVPGLFWMYSPVEGWIYVEVNSGGDFQSNDGSGWVGNNFNNPNS